MKKAIIFMALGVIGLAQYVYFQFTPLVYIYDGVVSEEIAGYTVITEVLYRRDWTLGIAGAIIGVILLVLGLYFLRRINNERKRA